MTKAEKHKQRYRDDPEYRKRTQATKRRYEEKRYGSKAGRRWISNKMRERNTGMPNNIYHQLIIDQTGRCAICEQPMTGTLEPATDHDHYNPGVFRGLLCTSCNVGLGHVEKPGWLHRALAYLEEHTFTAP